MPAKLKFPKIIKPTVSSTLTATTATTPTSIATTATLTTTTTTELTTPMTTATTTTLTTTTTTKLTTPMTTATTTILTTTTTTRLTTPTTTPTTTATTTTKLKTPTTTEIEEIKFEDIIATTTELFEESTESILENFNTLPPDTFEKEQLELDQIVENMVPIARLDEIEEIDVEILDYDEIITTEVADETTTLIGNIEEIEYIDDQSLNSIIVNQESVLPKETQLCQGDLNIVLTNL